jgi:Fic family protein
MLQTPTKPTRFLSALFIGQLTDFVTYAVHKYEMSLEEVLIVCLVASRSTRTIIENNYDSKEFGFENNSLPNKYRSPVKLKHIYTSLGINRETARRRLKHLVGRKFLIKTKEGFIFPQQENENDYTRDIREKLSYYLETFKYKSANL